MEAKYYTVKDGKNVRCELCPHYCFIKKGHSGICKNRVNDNGMLRSENYGVVSSLGFDPVEKKPLYHFYPASEILSVGSLGCNLQCVFCQNWEISQSLIYNRKRNVQMYDPETVISFALSRENNLGIAYTYNEPTVFFEYVIDVAKLSKAHNLKNVMVTNGFINPKPLSELNKYIDAYSVDLKAFEEGFFKKYTKSRLEPVKETLENISKAGKHLEITNLVIPALNDDHVRFKEMIKWISTALGENTVLHISRYHPMYKLSVEPTSVKRMTELQNIAKEFLNYVFLGNVNLPEGNNTYCPKCNELLIKRNVYITELVLVEKDGGCGNCGHHILDFTN